MKQIEASFSVSPRILDHLGIAAYNSLRKCLAELAANSYMKVRLARLSKDLQLPATDVIRRHLHKALPQLPDFRVFVNEVECTAEDVTGERHAFAQDIAGVGNVGGFYIVSNSRQSSPGLSIRVRGRLVTEPSLFGLDTRAHGCFTAEKIVGEINADFLDPEGSAGHIHGLINTSRDGFLEDSPIVQGLIRWAQDFLKEVIQGVDTNEQKNVQTNFSTDQEYENASIECRPMLEALLERSWRALFPNSAMLLTKKQKI
jgi:hypothetical protein